jgi:hypothetical protein
MSLWK